MRVNFKHAKLSHKDKKKKRIQEVVANQVMTDSVEGQPEYSKMERLGLSKAKRQQIFKKHKKKDVQSQIAELRIQSKKFKKKDVS